jgi:hypothetical protein
MGGPPKERRSGIDTPDKNCGSNLASPRTNHMHAMIGFAAIAFAEYRRSWSQQVAPGIAKA